MIHGSRQGLAIALPEHRPGRAPRNRRASQRLLPALAARKPRLRLLGGFAGQTDPKRRTVPTFPQVSEADSGLLPPKTAQKSRTHGEIGARFLRNRPEPAGTSPRARTRQPQRSTYRLSSAAYSGDGVPIPAPNPPLRTSWTTDISMSTESGGVQIHIGMHSKASESLACVPEKTIQVNLHAHKRRVALSRDCDRRLLPQGRGSVDDRAHRREGRDRCDRAGGWQGGSAI